MMLTNLCAANDGPIKEDSLKVTANTESDDQTPMLVVFEGCGGDGCGVVFDNSIKCSWCCLYEASAGVQHSLCYSKLCDQNEGTTFSNPVCGDCIRIDDNPNFDPFDPASPPYRLFVYSTNQTFYIFTFSTVEESDGLLINFTTE